MYFLFYIAAISVVLLKLEMLKCFKHEAFIKQHSKLHGIDVNETGALLETSVVMSIFLKFF
jgi:hypothetical protein